MTAISQSESVATPMPIPEASTEKAPPANNDTLDSALLKVALVVVLGAIMSILDVTVVNVAINDLARTFETSLSTIQWVSTGYTLALATVIPLTGWGADRFGTKRLYMMSITLFVLGSALSGAAWSAESLIFFRILQGFGGGMLMPAGMTILTRAAGPHRIGRVMSVIGVPMLLGPVFGPILGGWLVDDFSWRWIFFINLPIGVLALVAAIRILPADVPAPNEKLDWVGLGLLSPGLAALIYGFAESGQTGGFGDVKVLVPAFIGALLLGLFGWHATHASNPLIDLRLFLNRTFAASTATLMLMIISVFGGMLLIPLYFQLVRGESALTTGLLLAPQGLGAMIAMPISGLLADRTGVGRIAPFGLIGVAVSFSMLTQLAADTSYWTISGLLFLMGLGMGFTMMPLFTGALQTLRQAAIARASTTLNITQQVGASIGTAVLTVILVRVMTGKLAEAAAASGQPAGSGGSLNSVFTLPPAERAQLMPLMADSFGQTFFWALGLVVVAFLVAAVFLPKKRVEPAGEDDGAAPVTAHMMG
jgi:EmrB/QacA subfamily drug resistance transporter